MDIAKVLGRRIRELRKKKGLTQEQLAEKAGVDLKYIGSLERQERVNPTIGTLERMATALSVTVIQLLSFAEQGPTEKRLRMRIAHVLDTCNEKELRLVLRLAEAVKKEGRG